MKRLSKGAAKRLTISLLMGVALSGCAYYGPPPAAYDAYPYGDGGPGYAVAPVSIDLGFGFYDHGRAYHHRGHGLRHGGYRGAYHGHRGHGRGRR